MRKNLYFMSIAIQEAYHGCKKYEGGPFGACIVKNNKVIANAHNTVLKDKDPTRHAEINAIRKAAKKLKTYDLSNCEIYSTAEPCPMCFSAIHWAKLKRITYGVKIKTLKELGFNELLISTAQLKKSGKISIIIKSKCMYRQNKKLLDFWEKLPNRKTY